MRTSINSVFHLLNFTTSIRNDFEKVVKREREKNTDSLGVVVYAFNPNTQEAEAGYEF